MKIVIVHDSVFGNTAQVANAIADALDAGNAVRRLTVQDAKGLDMSEVDLLIVGSPTRGFRPTPLIAEFAESIGVSGAGKLAATFDTRIDLETINPAPLRWVVEAGGYAASRIAASLERHGLVMKSAPAGFLVTGTEGPLKAGELKRASEWAAQLLA